MYENKYRKYKKKYKHMQLGRALSRPYDSSERPVFVPMVKELHELMPEYNKELIRVLHFLEIGWINYTVDKGKDVLFDFFVKNMLKLIDKIINNKFNYNDKIFQQSLEGLVRNTEEENKKLHSNFIKEIMYIYKKKPYKKKKFINLIKELINQMLNKEYDILKKYGLVEGDRVKPYVTI